MPYEILLQHVSIVPCLCVFGISHFGLYYLYSSTRDYIYEVNMRRYGDKLGPTYDWLVSERGATNMEIINSSSRPNANIDKLLSGFEEWLRRQ